MMQYGDRDRIMPMSRCGDPSLDLDCMPFLLAVLEDKWTLT